MIFIRCVTVCHCPSLSKPGMSLAQQDRHTGPKLTNQTLEEFVITITVFLYSIYSNNQQ